MHVMEFTQDGKHVLTMASGLEQAEDPESPGWAANFT